MSVNKTVEEPKKYRLVVRSAEEAVRLIREKLGDHARVTSVRQVGGEGLKRFISSPKLEVIAEVGGKAEEDKALPENVSNELSSVEYNRMESHSELPQDDSTTLATVQSTKTTGNLVPDISGDAQQSDTDLVRILSRSGFDEALLQRLQSWSNWHEISDLPMADALKEITKGLADRLVMRKQEGLSQSIALIGTPGVGKTTTLCKLLAHEVFINKRVPNVLKIENGIPNPDDALRIFCEVIGVTLYREVENCPAATDLNPLFVDVPGLSMTDASEWEKAGQVLEHKKVDSRILVVNSAYDSSVLSRTLNLASHAKATHLAITHFDELSNSTKLWPLLLDSSLLAFCVCNGQNVTGDFSTGVVNQLIARTFPQELYAKNLFSYQRA